MTYPEGSTVFIYLYWVLPRSMFLWGFTVVSLEKKVCFSEVLSGNHNTKRTTTRCRIRHFRLAKHVIIEQRACVNNLFFGVPHLISQYTSSHGRLSNPCHNTWPTERKLWSRLFIAAFYLSLIIACVIVSHQLRCETGFVFVAYINTVGFHSAPTYVLFSIAEIGQASYIGWVFCRMTRKFCPFTILLLSFAVKNTEMTVSSLAAQLSKNRKKLREEVQVASAAESTPLGKIFGMIFAA